MTTPAAPTVAKVVPNTKITWLAGTLANGTPVTSYIVKRTVGATTTTICSPAVGTLTCNDTSPGTLPATYTVTNVYKSWTSAASPGTTFTYDATAPVTTASSAPAPNTAGWNNTAPTLTLTATDTGGTGVGSITYKIGTASSVTVNATTTNFAVSAQGTTAVTYYATDVAGNVESTKTYTVKLDTGAPTTTRTLLPAPNAAGWNSSTPTVTLTATDSGASGIASITYQVGAASPVAVNNATANFPVTAQGSTTVTYFATDVAGNVEATNSFVVKRDAGAPVLTVTSPVEGANYGPGAGNADWGALCGAGPANDGLCGTAPAPASGVQSMTFTLLKDAGPMNQCWNGTAFSNATTCPDITISLTSLPNWFYAMADNKLKKADYVLVVTVTSGSGLTTSVTRNFSHK